MKRFVDRTFTCDDLGGGAADAVAAVVCGGLGGRRHVGSGAWLRNGPGGAREGPVLVGRQWAGLGALRKRGVWRGGGAGWRGLGLYGGLVRGWRLRGGVSRGVDGAVLARVAPRGDGGIMGGARCLATRLRCKWTGLFWGGGGLLLGTFSNKWMAIEHQTSTEAEEGKIPLPLRTMWGLGPRDPP